MRGEAPPNILMVDDDTHVLRSLRAALESHGYRVRSAVNGPTALESFAAERPDVVLLDLALPGLDGVEVCRRLRNWARTTDSASVSTIGAAPGGSLAARLPAMLGPACPVAMPKTRSPPAGRGVRWPAKTATFTLASAEVSGEAKAVRACSFLELRNRR